MLGQCFAVGVAAAVSGASLTSPSKAAALKYDLTPVEVAPGTWMLAGAQEDLRASNGGFIANTSIVEVPGGIVLFCSGPSRRFGEALVDLVRQLIPGKRVIRVFNTHHHPDHFLGNQAFDASLIAAPPAVIEGINAEGEPFLDNMYRLLGDWMRGTRVVAPGVALTDTTEVLGGRSFSYFYLGGHSAVDLVVRDDLTGIVFAGDLAFLDRAPATPHAELTTWQASLGELSRLNTGLLMPGHGPFDRTGQSLQQTSDYLKWLDDTLRTAVSRGLTMTEAMALPIPTRFDRLAVVRAEYVRSVVHLYSDFEDQLLRPARLAG